MITLKEKAVLRPSKINPSDRVFYTTDGTEPTSESTEWTGGDITVYGHTRLRTLIEGGGDSTPVYSTFPSVFIVIPDFSGDISLTATGFSLSLPSKFSYYHNLRIEVYRQDNSLYKTVTVSNLNDIQISIDHSGIYQLKITADSVFSDRLYTTPEIEFICQNPSISYVLDSEEGEAMVTIAQNGVGTTYYTLDGTDPSPSNGSQYTAPFPLETTKTVKAITVNEGWTSSSIITKQVLVYRQMSFPIGEDSFVIGIGNVLIGDVDITNI